MPERSVTPSKEFCYSELFLDFLNWKPSLEKYFSSQESLEVAAKLGQTKVDRNLLCDVLIRQNISFKAKPRTFKVIEKLRQEDSLCIFTGQQAGLYGGPLLTLYKAIGITKLARQLERELRRPVAPIFWIAADDHDFNEINHLFYCGHDGDIRKLHYDLPPTRKVPISEIRFDDSQAYELFVQDTRGALGLSDFTDELYTRLFAAYSFNNTLADAFGQYLLDILPDLGLILFSPADKEIKTVSKGFFKHLVEGHFKLKESLEATSLSLKNDGYHIQVEKKESAVHLFFHNPERIPIHFLNDAYVVGEKTLGLTGLLDLIDKYPDKFSPDVLTRPLWQSFLFPVVAQMGGPSEIAYFSQIGKLFNLFNLVQPHYYPRPALTLVEKRQEELLEKYGLNLPDITGDIENVVKRVTIQSFPKEIEAKIADFRAKFEDAYNEFFSVVRNYDDHLEPMGKQTYGKIDFALNAFEKKIYDHHKQRMQSTRSQIYRLASALFPNSNLQERSLNINQFIAKYGFGIVDFIIKNVDVGTIEHQIIYISEYQS
ncbi:MAG: bacillithiol biosynthesis cysteine-adding enzyme BshC [candidate division Zixibacteria bacterium]|nr:bacillithiol biosynthesis cysteine-adding enzyme BshC [candidate division Zixibacteria bacterium]